VTPGVVTGARHNQVKLSVQEDRFARLRRSLMFGDSPARVNLTRTAISSIL
jgi:hypothetical protein